MQRLVRLLGVPASLDELDDMIKEFSADGKGGTPLHLARALPISFCIDVPRFLSHGKSILKSGVP